MPKHRRDRSVSADRCGTSPFPSCSSHEGLYSPKISIESNENIKEWEEARCPVCMEHPHNAVLLICSSHEKGCRPYMCNTSYRHSNCLDQFHKSFMKSTRTDAGQDNQLLAAQSTSALVVSEESSSLQAVVSEGSSIVQAESNDNAALPITSSDNQALSKLVCPLCRGHIKDWIIVESARQFMNAKVRSCACETCNFSGNYSDLRKHARLEHPLARPSEADPERQRNWRRLVRQRHIRDMLSTFQPPPGLESGEYNIVPGNDNGGLLTVFFLVRVGRPRNRPRIRVRTHPRMSTTGGISYSGRTLTTLWADRYEEEHGSSSREDNESSDNDDSARTLGRRVRSRLSPDNQS